MGRLRTTSTPQGGRIWLPLTIAATGESERVGESVFERERIPVRECELSVLER
jgi:hypothetical protein